MIQGACDAGYLAEFCLVAQRRCDGIGCPQKASYRCDVTLWVVRVGSGSIQRIGYAHNEIDARLILITISLGYGSSSAIRLRAF